MKGLTLKICEGLGLMLVVLVPTLWAAEKISIFVSIAPQKYQVEKIGGHRVTVSVMAAPGADPHIFEPKPQQMVSLSNADIYFSIGIGLEKAWLKKIEAANPRLQIVQTDRGIKKIPMPAHAGQDGKARHDIETPLNRQRDQHAGSGEEHRPGALDPHIWLSPPLVMIQARHILNTLVSIDPDHSDLYIANYRNFLAELVDLDLELINIFSKRGANAQFLVYHPAWGYFADAYGLEQIPIEIEGKNPKPAQLMALINYAKKHGIKVIFAQPQFSTKSVQIVAREIGGRVVLADPLALDWTDNLRRQADAFKTLFSKE